MKYVIPEAMASFTIENITKLTFGYRRMEDSPIYCMSFLKNINMSTVMICLQSLIYKSNVGFRKG